MNYLGSQWSLFPPHDSTGGMNITNKARTISSQILSIILTHKGTRYIYPSFGIAPDLFEPLSNYKPRYLAIHLKDEILKWNYKLNMGIEALDVGSIVYEDHRRENGIDLVIEFRPQNEVNANVLTVGYWEYIDILKNYNQQSIRNFIREVRLNNDGIVLENVNSRYQSKSWKS